MKILLVRPYSKDLYSVVPPLGLGYLAASLKQKGHHQVLLYEAARDRLPKLDSFERYVRKSVPDLVGIQVYSVDLAAAREYLECVKRISRRIITVAGGPHPSALPEETMRYCGDSLDYIIAGEGEESFPLLAEHLSDGRAGTMREIDGLVWRNEDGAISKNGKARIRDLNHLPWPDWELLDPGRYPDAPQGGFGKGFPLAPVSVSRGCPMSCTFCGGKSIYGEGFRARSADSVVAEIQMLKTRFGVREIMVQDDNLTFDKHLLLDFCGKIRPLAMNWNCLNGIRLNPVDDEVASAMKAAGCYAVGVGIESGSQKILNDMKKGLTLETIREKINILRRHGIWVTGLFILGYPTENEADIRETIAFARRLNIDRAAFTNFLPLPGSSIFAELKQTLRIQDGNLSERSYYRACESYSPHLSAHDINRLLREATLSFYLRPAILFRLVRQIGSVSNLLHILERFVKNYLFCRK